MLLESTAADIMQDNAEQNLSVFHNEISIYYFAQNLGGVIFVSHRQCHILKEHGVRRAFIWKLDKVPSFHCAKKCEELR